MTLADFTSPGMIVPHLHGTDVASVIHELSQVLKREERIPDSLPFYHAALNREFMVSTELPEGMAFPHARVAGLKEVSFSLGRSDGPLRWGTRSGGSVRLVFLLAVPATDSTQYLLLISGLARLARDHQLLEQLHQVQEASQIVETLRRVELRSPPPANRARKALH